jgi:hypothetical protein
MRGDLNSGIKLCRTDTYERLHYLSEILDPSSIMPIIDLPKVRSLTMPGMLSRIFYSLPSITHSD